MADAIHHDNLPTLVEHLGGAANIRDVSNCMTRLRVRLADESLVDAEAIRALPGVMGLVVAGGQHQIVLGVGKAGRAADLLRNFLGKAAPDLQSVAKENRAAVKATHNTRLHGFLTTFATIFTPLIPGFIAAGLLLGGASLIEQIAGKEALAVTVGDSSVPTTLGHLVFYMKLFSKSLTTFLGIMIGHNAARAFGGTGVHGAILAGFFILVYSAEAKGIYSGMTSFFGHDIDPRGGIIGILIAAILCAKVEQFVRRFIPDNLDMILTSTITLLIMGVITFLVIMPLAARLFTEMSWLFSNINNNPLGTAVLAGLFLIAVMLGIHQGFVPVYFAIFEAQGFNALFPVLAMAGAGQVGAAVALYLRAARDSMLRQQIRGAIIPGFLGVGEPLIYGVTLPRIKPFITACLGGAVGGFVIGLIAWLGYPVGLNSVFGPSGLLALPLMTSAQGAFFAMGVYLTGMVSAWIAGFTITWFFASKDVDLS
ncbi:MAG: PTS N-acetylmuramic acid transporter subunit IIBC [Cardiobacteriaceae bacterium]|nr:PTS N-acetylmuramic acid transporter subunit IIBC [Cardiobacteriaceae bacterium]